MREQYSAAELEQLKQIRLEVESAREKTCQPFWAIAFHTNSIGPRARRWYRVARMIEVDGMTFELYWHADVKTRGNSRADIVAAATEAGIALVPGTYSDGPAPRLGSTMIRRS